jgi:hypothetical protein
MNYVHLSPHFPPNYYLFSVNLARLGVNVLGLADEAYDKLRPELRAALAEYYYVPDMHNYDDLVRACGYLTRHGKLHRIDAFRVLDGDRARYAPISTSLALTCLISITNASRSKAAYQRAGVTVAAEARSHPRRVGCDR